MVALGKISNMITFLFLLILSQILSNDSFRFTHCASTLFAYRLPSYCNTKDQFSKCSQLAMSLRVALTRENGSNDKLKDLIPDLDCFEIPCIAFSTSEDTVKLAEAITSHDIVAITSPQAATVFLDSWDSIGKPPVTVVTVGKGTSKPLRKEGIIPLFEPSDATAAALAEEIPLSIGKTILYPSSALADNKLVSGLESRGFKVFF